MAGRVARWVWVAALLAASCGGGQGGGARSTEGPAELFPDAPAQACQGVPVLGEDVSFAEIAEGEEVAMDAVPRQGAGQCTLMACGKSNPCCNRCSGAYTITVTGADRAATAIQLDGLKGCSGTECGMTCEPFGRKPTIRYRFVGRMAEKPAQSGVRYRLAVDRFCVASDGPAKAPAPVDEPGPGDKGEDEIEIDDDMTDEELEKLIEENVED